MKTYHILIIEDDPIISAQLKKFFMRQNYTVSIVSDGELALHAVKALLPDIVILDVNLPNKDGFTCCQEIRSYSDLPVLFLSGRTSEQDRITGFQVGADDYITKPFSVNELRLRIERQLTRFERQLRPADISLDNRQQIIKYKDKLCRLSYVEYLLFKTLFQKPGQIYSREQILNLAYPEKPAISSRTIDSHIKNIRSKLLNLNIGEELISSVYGKGYFYQSPSS